MTRGRKPGECYVYAILDGAVVLYVGKGTGRRASTSARKHGGTIKFLERDLTDDLAFAAERKWIAELTPQNNKSPGGNGGRVVPKPISKDEARFIAEMKQAEAMGTRRYAARELLKLDLSVVVPSSEVDRIRQVLLRAA